MTESRSGFFRFPSFNPAVASVTVLTGLCEQDFWLEANFFFNAKPKAPRIHASSEASIVSIPAKCELDQLEKDTNPKV